MRSAQAWVLGTWHASLIVLVFAVATHAAGDLGPVLGGVGLGAGLALFAWLWILAVWTAHSVLRATGRLRRVQAAAWAGAGAGAAFVGGAGAVALVAAAREGGAEVWMGLPFLLVAAAVAAVAGAIVGLLLACVDVSIAGRHGTHGQDGTRTP